MEAGREREERLEKDRGIQRWSQIQSRERRERSTRESDREE
jgi:hypothetical protein